MHNKHTQKTWPFLINNKIMINIFYEQKKNHCPTLLMLEKYNTKHETVANIIIIYNKIREKNILLCLLVIHCPV